LEISDFQALISPSRLQKYSGVADYISGVGRASQMHQILHWVEVGFRNHIDEGIQTMSTSNHSCGSWLTCKCSKAPVCLNANSTSRIQRTVGYLKENDRDNPDSIIPGLSFGFWVRLLSSANEPNIWTVGLHKSFPRKTKRSDLHDRLRKMNLIRNRVAHLEPVDTYSLTQIANESLSLIHPIAPNLDEFMAKEFRRILKDI